MDLSLLLNHPLYLVTAALYAVATVFYAVVWRSKNPLFGRLGTGVLWAGLLANLGLIAGRWIEAGRPPFKSLFESLVVLAFCFAATYVIMERLYRTRVFGALASLGALGSILFALTKWDAEIIQLPPALQSGWFVPHVVVYFFAYGALFFATVAAGAQLFRPEFTVRSGTALTGVLRLEDISYQSIRFGFLLLTFGLLVGSVWAKDAWGDYWVWDPKENWSLVSWLVYAAYLHLRHVTGWRGKKGAWLAIAGFGAVLFTYLGMELLPTAAESDHVYTSNG